MRGAVSERRLQTPVFQLGSCQSVSRAQLVTPASDELLRQIDTVIVAERLQNLVTATNNCPFSLNARRVAVRQTAGEARRGCQDGQNLLLNQQKPSESTAAKNLSPTLIYFDAVWPIYLARTVLTARMNNRSAQIHVPERNY